ncbi:divalent-cation tolerance protein CutA [Sphingomonas parva]|uniref:Divalent-cation tolerance protein CutA n=1 Tax=Sphingomonas parva TaxID=2555898 RepID=A0A4Y8ZUR6_9SPHN|nr:divalent-cation tolerance protein CutA [Sphingomonas parva]
MATVYATFASHEEAERVARALVEERLAACANIFGTCRSIYRWEGRIADGEETAALFKTAADRADALIARLAELHSYDLPAAVAWPIAASTPGFAKWVLDETAQG